MSFKLHCEVESCDFEAANDDKDIMLAQYASHQRNHENGATPIRAGTSRAAKVERPKIGMGSSEESWNTFLSRWSNYKRTAAIPVSLAAGELFECCESDLGDDVIKQNSALLEGNETPLLEAIKKLAVIPIAVSVRRKDVLQMKMDHGEGVRSYYARVKGKADTCSYAVRCECGKSVDYTTHQIKDVLVVGLNDPEIQREVLGWPELDKKSVAETVAFIESKEMARNAMSHSSSSTNAVNSSYRNLKNNSDANGVEDKEKEKQMGKCPTCKKDYHLFRISRYTKRYNEKAFTTCYDCNPRKPARKGDKKKGSVDALATENAGLFSSLGAIADTVPHAERVVLSKAQGDDISIPSVIAYVTPQSSNANRGKKVVLTNKIFDGELGWQTAKRQHHPRVRLRATTSKDDYEALGISFPRIAASYVDVVTDSGAQSCLMGMQLFVKCGFKVSDLVEVDHGMCAANKVPIKILGAIILRLDGRSRRGEVYECAVMAFVSPDTEDFFLSKEAMQQLAIIPKDFPNVGAADVVESTTIAVSEESSMELPQPPQLPTQQPPPPITGVPSSLVNAPPLPPQPPQVNATTTPDAPPAQPQPVIAATTAAVQHPEEATKATEERTDTSEECHCPERAKPPGRPVRLPFPPKPEFNLKFEKWLKERYAASTFNQCPHQPLPEVVGPKIPPLAIHVEENAVPVVHHKPGFIPLHHYDQVIADLRRDIAMGVLEYPPLNEPVVWCHKMIIVTKPDGTPRRAVDMSPLNKFCKREPHIGKNPFQMAHAIPRNVWKSVQDAWNGYHGIPIREEDRHLTTFQTPIGMLRYARAPQGALCSGDGYNQRFDIILSEFDRVERCVDDAAYWDEDLEAHWWRTIDFLEITGLAGVVLNPKKFQCCKREIEFAGFHVTDTAVLPLAKYLDAIRNFPTPKNITDIRAWFGLTNQVAHYAQLRDLVAPMRPLLKKNARFEWSPELNEVFEQSKQQIVEAIKSGVEIFDKNRTTSLSTDWSKSGVGYYLNQKHCNCEQKVGPRPCCPDGWRITLAGSRQLKAAESRYAPIEGEALALVWSLNQTKYFTIGCDDLTLITDHKPLVKVFGDRTLDEIQNMRLFKLKEKTLPWRFDIIHRPGKTHFAADATSRNPVGDAEDDDLMCSEIAMIGSMSESFNKVQAVTWSRVKAEMQRDKDMRALLELVSKGLPENRQEMPPEIIEYFKYRESIYEVDGVLICRDRILIPPKLREEVLEGLHAAHHGTDGMDTHAHSRIIWPGITCDTEKTRMQCMTCNRNAPSNPRQSPEEPTIPSMPFECVCADYFQLEANHYLVAVDRLSGWCEVFQAKSGTATAGSKGLVAALRKLFGCFGVPLEISSDEGSEFTASETKDFLNRWGVGHRESSAYHPSSNGRAELGVKSMKRLLRDNVGPGGSLNNDRFLRALLTHRNTPDPISKKSPAEVLFGRKLRDSLPVFEGGQNDLHNNDRVLPVWREGWMMKEQALRARAVKSIEKMSEHSKELPPLRHDDRVLVQNQTGTHPTKWDRTGVIKEVLPHDKYGVIIDATGRLTYRNRQFLRKYIPVERSVLTGIPAPVDPLPSTPLPSTPQPATSQPTTSQPTTTEVNDRPVESDEHPTHEVRRSSRVKKQKQVYDASEGKYVNPEG